MARFFQYQNRTQAPPGASPATQQLSWFQAWSEPPVKTGIAPRLAIALMVSGLFAPITPQFFAGTGTAIANSVPTNVQFTQQFQYQGKTEPVPFPAQSSSYSYPWSEPVRVKIGLPAHQQQVLAWNTTTPAAASDIRWIYSWSEPTRRTGLQTHLQDVGTPDVPLPPPVLASQWSYPWSEPVRTKRGLGAHLQDTAAPDISLPPPVLASQWIYGWSDPVRTKVGLSAQQQQTLAWNTSTPSSEVITADKWIYPWSEPVRQRKFQTSLQDVGAPDVVNPPPVLVSQWFEPWIDPVRQKIGIGAQQQQALAWSTFTPAVAATTDIRWIYQWSEPVRLKAGLGSHLQPQIDNPPPFPIIPRPGTGTVVPVMQDGALQYEHRFQYQALAAPVTTPTSVVSTDIVTSALSSPIFFKGRVIYQSYTKPVFIAGDITNVGRWFEPLSEPVRIRPAAQQQQVLAWNTTTPVAVVVNYGWFSPLATPVQQKIVVSEATFNFMAVDNALTNFWYAPWPDFTKAKTSILTAQQQALAWSNFTPAAVVVTDIRWYQPWSEPVRTRQFAAAQQQVLAWSTFTPAAAVVPEDRWHQPWSEPVRLRRLPTADSDAALIQTIQPPTILVSQWFSPLSEPVRIKQGLLAALQQAQIDTVEFPTLPAGVVTGYALSSPVFYRGRFIYQSYTKPSAPPAAEVITADKWAYPWSEPVRVRRFDTAQQQSLAFIPLITNASNNASIYYPWSEPVRLKVGLRTHLQSFTSLAVPPAPNFIRTINWYQPLSEPVRIKQGLRPWLQQFFTAGTRPIPANITVVLNATETNGDVALFAAIVYNPAVRCVVSIRQISAIDRAAASVEEVPAINGAVASIEEA